MSHRNGHACPGVQDDSSIGSEKVLFVELKWVKCSCCGEEWRHVDLQSMHLADARSTVKGWSENSHPWIWLVPLHKNKGVWSPGGAQTSRISHLVALDDINNLLAANRTLLSCSQQCLAAFETHGNMAAPGSRYNNTRWSVLCVFCRGFKNLDIFAYL